MPKAGRRLLVGCYQKTEVTEQLNKCGNFVSKQSFTESFGCHIRAACAADLLCLNTTHLCRLPAVCVDCLPAEVGARVCAAHCQDVRGWRTLLVRLLSSIGMLQPQGLLFPFCCDLELMQSEISSFISAIRPCIHRSPVSESSCLKTWANGSLAVLIT